MRHRWAIGNAGMDVHHDVYINKRISIYPDDVFLLRELGREQQGICMPQSRHRTTEYKGKTILQ
jgi:hypothetical protein